MVIAVEEKQEKGSRGLSAYEQETIINFNKEEKIAYIFTYEKTWQRHLEQKLGLKPTKDNGFGGREYELPKDRIPMPRVKKVLSEDTKKRMVDNLKAYRAAVQG